MTTAQQLDTRKFSPDVRHALDTCAPLMTGFGKQALTVELLCLALLRDTPQAAEALPLLERLARQRTAARANFCHRPADGSAPLWLSPPALAWLDDGLARAEAAGQAHCQTAHLLATLPAPLANLLASAGIDLPSLDEAPAGDPVFTDLVARFRAGTGTEPFDRPALLDPLQTWLASRRPQRHIILLGPPGVGKLSLLHALAARIARGQNPAGLKTVILPDERALLDNPLFTLKAGLQAARDGLFCLPHLARFFPGPGTQADFPPAVLTAVRQVLLDPDLTLIATETPARLDACKHDPLLTATCHPLTVPPATPPEAEAILRAQRPALEHDYPLTIDPAAPPEAVRLAARYRADTPLPASALHLMHYTAALVTAAARPHLEPDDLRIATGILCGLPLRTLSPDDRARTAALPATLAERVIGQDAALAALSHAVQAARVGLKDPHRPAAAFLLIGPTGVGKTETAKALADCLFADPNALIALDMSEYMSETAAARLIGAPPGYVGYQAGGQLTAAVKAKPYSVILFDEIEKAAPRIFDLLLQVLDEGRLTDGQGQTVSFRDSIILLTSNVPADHLPRHFRPEFLNRLDGIIPFQPLDDAALARILDLLLAREAGLLAGQGYRLTVDPRAAAWLLARYDRPDWGARPLRRLIADHLRPLLTGHLLTGQPAPGAQLRVTVRDGVLHLVTTPGGSDDPA